MATIQRFEDIEAWQVARELTNKVYEATKGDTFSRDYGLKDQIQRAAVSVMSNIAEGFERDGNKEFANFLGIAKGSVGEVRSQLYVALDQKYITQQQFDFLFQQCVRVSAMLHNFRTTIQNSPHPGNRYK